MEDLEDFKAKRVFIEGEEVARDGEYLPELEKYPIDSVSGSFVVKDFSKEKLKFKLDSNEVYVIDVFPGEILSEKGKATVEISEDGDFVYNPDQDIAKVAVVERYQNTGNVALGLLRGYGIKKGAIAVSIAHDSHNIIVVGVNDDDMEMAVAILKFLKREKTV